MTPPRRWLIVVAEDQPILRRGLRLSFADDPSVEVVLDRRATEPGPPLRAGQAPSEQRQPLSPEQSVVWRDLRFVLVDRWKGMAVYETRTPEPPTP